MIIEFIISTTLQEWISRKFKRKPRNNVKEIKRLIRSDRNDVKTVGELREILSNFSDDVSMGNSYEWHHVQVREINGKGSINIGKVQTWGK